MAKLITPEFRARWLQPSPDSQASLLRNTPVLPETTAPLILGLRGHALQLEYIKDAFAFSINMALWNQKNPDIPVYDVYDNEGHPTDIVVLDCGMMQLSRYHRTGSLGKTTEGLVFIKNSGSSWDDYWSTVNSVVRQTNRILVSEGLQPLPTPGDYYYPVSEAFKF